jgi:hypothetical protein
MTKGLRALAVAGCVAAVPAMGATPALWLSNGDITAALAGKTLEGRYASGRAFVERYGADGRVEYLEKGQTIGGHWSVTAGTLCTIYDTDPTGGCFRVVKASENCFEFYFVTRTEEAAPGPVTARPAWTARGAVSGQPSACREGASV